MAHRDGHCCHSEHLGPRRRSTVERHQRRVSSTASYLDLAKTHLSHPNTEGLHDCLLGRQTGSQRSRPSRRRASGCCRQFCGSKQAPSQTRAPSKGAVESIDRHKVRPDPDQRVGSTDGQVGAHSTVTVLARFRGRSTSRPLPTAKK